MRISLTVTNEHHAQLISSVVHNMMDSAFNDVTLVCNDGQMRVNGLALALLLPSSYRNLPLGEGALLLLPQHTLQEVWAMVEPESRGKVQGQERVAWQDPIEIQLNKQENGVKQDENKLQDSSEILDVSRIKFQDNQTEPFRDSEMLFYGMEDSPEEDSDQEIEDKDRKQSIMNVGVKEEHMSQEELSKVSARYIASGRKSNTWLIVDEKFIFHRNTNNPAKGAKRGTVVWSCSGRYNFGCTAKALTQRVPRDEVSQIEAGCPVRLVYIWRSQLHTCKVDYSHIFTRDLKNRIRQCWLENPTLKYKTVFDDSKAFLISRIPSKDIRKKLRQECRLRVFSSWFYKMTNGVRT